jgi:hypothetical protein
VVAQVQVVELPFSWSASIGGVRLGTTEILFMALLAVVGLGLGIFLTRSV